MKQNVRESTLYSYGVGHYLWPAPCSCSPHMPQSSTGNENNAAMHAHQSSTKSTCSLSTRWTFVLVPRILSIVHVQLHYQPAMLSTIMQVEPGALLHSTHNWLNVYRLWTRLSSGSIAPFAPNCKKNDKAIC